MTETTGKQPFILYVITKSNWGGAGRYVYDLACHFKETARVKVALGGNGTLFQKLEEKGIPTIHLAQAARDARLGRDIRGLFELIKLFWKEKPDIVHLNSSKIGFSGGLAARITGIPRIIFTAHGWASNEARSLPVRIFFHILHWWTILFSHITIAVSEKTASDMLGMPWVQRKIRVIYNAIHPIPFYSKTTARELLKKRYPTLPVFAKILSVNKKIWLGTLSELHSNKGLDFIIKSLYQLKKQGKENWIFFICGGGELHQTLHNLITSYGLENHIFLLGHVSDAPYYLKAFDIFTLTSRTEALPYVVLEAGHAGIPVIASAVGGIPEIIDQLESGILVKPGNIKELTHTLALLIDSKEKRTELGTVLHKKVTQSFGVEQFYENTARAYFHTL